MLYSWEDGRAMDLKSLKESCVDFCQNSSPETTCCQADSWVISRDGNDYYNQYQCRSSSATEVNTLDDPQEILDYQLRFDKSQF